MKVDPGQPATPVWPLPSSQPPDLEQDPQTPSQRKLAAASSSPARANRPSKGGLPGGHTARRFADPPCRLCALLWLTELLGWQESELVAPKAKGGGRRSWVCRGAVQEFLRNCLFSNKDFSKPALCQLGLSYGDFLGSFGPKGC